MSSNSLFRNARLEIVYRSVADLQPDPRNPRVHNKRHIRQLSKSIQSFGFNVPILIGESGRVVAGHGRLEAARLLGMTEAPTLCLDHLDEQQRQAFMIADNRLTDLSSWNKALLGQVLLELSESDLCFDIEAVGFSVGEIDLLINSPEDASGADDELPEPGPAVSKLGDIWDLEEHVIICGSALHEETYDQLMGRDRADLVFTDPPYNVPIKGHVSGLGKVQHREFEQGCGEMSENEFIAFLERSMHHAARWSRDGSLHYWAMDWRHQYELMVAAREIYTEQVNLCVWAKTAAGMGSLYRSQHELFSVWRKGEARHRNNVQLGRFGRSRSNVWSYPGVTGFGRHTAEGDLLAMHPTTKPVELIADAILDSTKRRDIVLDPFLGSGSTLIAAAKIGRQCRGIELDPAYIDTIIRRWQRWTGDQARRRDGVLFNEMEAAARG